MIITPSKNCKLLDGSGQSPLKSVVNGLRIPFKEERWLKPLYCTLLSISFRSTCNKVPKTLKQGTDYVFRYPNKIQTWRWTHYVASGPCSFHLLSRNVHTPTFTCGSKTLNLFKPAIAFASRNEAGGCCWESKSSLMLFLTGRKRIFTFPKETKLQSHYSTTFFIVKSKYSINGNLIEIQT